MTQELASSRDELVSHNEELSALNSITATVSQSLNLEEVLENAMQKVLEVTKTTAGCVFLRDSDSNKLEIMSSIGSLSAFRCKESGSPAANCAWALLEAVAIPIEFQDVAVMSQAVEEGSGQPLVAEDLQPAAKLQV